MAVLNARPKLAIQNLVLLTDFSEASELALGYAASIARHYGSKIHLVHALHPLAERSDAKTASLPLESEAGAEARLHAAGEKCSDVEHSEWLLRGTSLAVVDRLLSFDKADLVVVGTHGSRGFRKAATGAAAEHFFRHVHCPVLAIGPSVPPCGLVWKPKHVLLATDLQSKETAAARCAVFGT